MWFYAPEESKDSYMGRIGLTDLYKHTMVGALGAQATATQDIEMAVCKVLSIATTAR